MKRPLLSHLTTACPRNELWRQKKYKGLCTHPNMWTQKCTCFSGAPSIVLFFFLAFHNDLSFFLLFAIDLIVDSERRSGHNILSFVSFLKTPATFKAMMR